MTASAAYFQGTGAHQLDRPLAARAVFSGASKDFFATEDPQLLLVRFKDVMHGAGRTREVKGTGRLRERFCFWFYRLLEREGIRTHLARSYARRPIEGNDALRTSGLWVMKLEMVALELVARFVTRGHWVDSQKFPVFPAGLVLPKPVTELCLKWQQDVPTLEYERLTSWQRRLHGVLARTPLSPVLLPKQTRRDDPRIGVDLAIALHQRAKSPRIRGHLIASREEAEVLRALTLRVNGLLRAFLREQDWTLEDGKFEVGVDPSADYREFVVGDEYTQDSSRIRDARGASLTKDLHRNMKSNTEIYDGYAKLAEAMEVYAR